MKQRCALIMAAGTGGHIFPGLAVAQALREAGWQVHWLGTPQGMENRLVPARGFALATVQFQGIRGKGALALVAAPWRLLRAVWQSWQVVRRVRPDVVLGFGGYITVPGGIASVLNGKPLVLHEQNSVAGMANRWLAKVATRVFTAFPKVLAGGEWVGNPLRHEFMHQAAPQQRFAQRSGPLKVLVVGGSLGARALNAVVPRALAQMTPDVRPRVTHQSGEQQIAELRANYAQAQVEATLTPFIEDTAQAFAEADLVVCRAGASTVTEIAAVGAAALFVPFPAAVDDHQTHNARFLVEQGAAWLVPQPALTPEWLAQRLATVTRPELQALATAAKQTEQLHATQAIVAACQELVA